MSPGHVFEFDDPYNLQATLSRGGNYEVLPLAKGSFHAEYTRVDFERLWLQRCEGSESVLLHIANDPTRAPMTFLADPDQGPWQQNGGDLPPDGISVYRRGADNHHVTEANRWASMSLTPDALAACGHAIAGRELTTPRETYIARPGPQLMARLRSLHAAACRLAKSNPEALACRATARSIEEDLVHTMVACLTAGQPTGSGVRRVQRARVMSRFEDYLADRPCEPLYLSEICAAIGASERTLRDCCHDHLGMGPHRYLWLRRMHLARHALRDADPARTSVTEVATEHGFWELGRFSVEYRSLFEESPSTTLRRPAA